MREEIFRMERVTRIERGMVRLEDFNLQVYKGEIMGLLPVNAHGMTAFLNLLQTNLPIRDGYVYYGGGLVNSWKESGREANRISIIQAQSCLVEQMTVTDNIFVLRQGYRQRMIRPGILQSQLEPFLRDIGIDLAADCRVEKLSVFERVVVELLKAVILGYRLIVLNEISTLISSRELCKLHHIMRHYAKRGFSFLYVSPHFEELVQLCGRVAMFSHGRIQKVLRGAEMDEECLRGYVEEYDSMVRAHLESCGAESEKGAPVLIVDGLTCGSLNRLNLNFYAGECVVIQNMDNEVYKDLTGLLTGALRAETGCFRMEGNPVEISGNRNAAVILEQPTRTMLFPRMSYMDNLCMGLSWRMPGVWNSFRIQKSIRKEYGKLLGEDVFDMQLEELDEKQKYQLVYMRVLLQKPRIVFCIQPFKGADMSHRMLVWKLLEMMLNKKIAVVILALNLADSISLAERLVIIGSDGSIEEITRDHFGTLSGDAPWRYLYREKSVKMTDGNVFRDFHKKTAEELGRP